MKDESHPGELQKLVLLAIIGLENNADATSIRKRLAERAKRDLSVGAMYVTLDRMEEKGFIGSKLGDAVAPTGNRRMKYFHVEPLGEQALEESVLAQERLAAGTPWDLSRRKVVA